MPMPPEQRVTALLQEAQRRLNLQAATRAASVGIAAGVIPFIITRRLWVAAVFTAVAATSSWWFSRRRRRHPAALLETRVTGCRNLLITAEALLEGRLHAKPEVKSVVLEDAARCAERISPAALWPWLRPAMGLGIAAALWVVAVMVPQGRLTDLVPGVITAASTPSVDSVEVVAIPPGYSGRPRETFLNPDRISVLAGSRVRLTIKADAAVVALETIANRQQAVRAGSDFIAEAVVTSDGFLAVIPSSEDGRAGARRLIGVTALPDRAPEVRLTEPGKDMFLRDAATAPLSVRLQAEDDIGLRSVKLAYTKVAGAGESFTFTEGEAPVTVTRTNERQWTASGVLPLDTMNLDLGDMVVYRAVALDSRPGSLPVESDAFIIEIVSAGDAMAEGFSIDDRQDKYALSQQMVIIKTERLLAKAASLSKEAMLEEALNIAAEQRSVRAEIVFMMGGEFEDEAVEAEHEHEIAEGRTDNSGRADLGRATRAMSRAAAQLTDVDLKTALVSERTALAAMQRALSRRRFILRTLTQRGQIDDTRRLQGKIAGLGSGARTVAPSATSGLVTAARQALLAVMEVSRQSSLTTAHASQLSAAAAGLLAVDGRGAPVVDVASRLTSAAEAIAAGTPDVAQRALSDATTRLIAIASAELATAPSAPANRETARLRGAVADALRGGGR
jgi:hypothetical protein